MTGQSASDPSVTLEGGELPRRERERLARRRAMLDAARAVFAEKGYEQATLDEVAERAEFGKGTLYNYFEGGKEGILRALVEDVFDGIEAVVETHLADADGRPVAEVFRALLADLMAHFEADRDTFRLIVKEVQRLMLSPENEVARVVWERDERLIGRVAVPLARAVEAGELRPFPPEAIARMLFGNAQGFLMYLLCTPDAAPTGDRSLAEEAAAFLSSVLFDGLRPRA